MVSDALGLDVDEITETIEPVVARERVKTQFPGSRRRASRRRAPDRARLCGRHGKNLHGIADVRRRAGAADTVEIVGNPNLSLTIPGGTHGDIATASVVVNCIPAILDAPAGLRTSRDLPMCFLPPDANP